MSKKGKQISVEVLILRIFVIIITDKLAIGDKMLRGAGICNDFSSNVGLKHIITYHLSDTANIFL